MGDSWFSFKSPALQIWFATKSVGFRLGIIKSVCFVNFQVGIEFMNKKPFFSDFVLRNNFILFCHIILLVKTPYFCFQTLKYSKHDVSMLWVEFFKRALTESDDHESLQYWKLRILKMLNIENCLFLLWVVCFLLLLFLVLNLCVIF